MEISNLFSILSSTVSKSCSTVECFGHSISSIQSCRKLCFVFSFDQLFNLNYLFFFPSWNHTRTSNCLTLFPSSLPLHPHRLQCLDTPDISVLLRFRYIVESQAIEPAAVLSWRFKCLVSFGVDEAFLIAEAVDE